MENPNYSSVRHFWGGLAPVLNKVWGNKKKKICAKAVNYQQGFLGA